MLMTSSCTSRRGQETVSQIRQLYGIATRSLQATAEYMLHDASQSDLEIGCVFHQCLSCLEWLCSNIVICKLMQHTVSSHIGLILQYLKLVEEPYSRSKVTPRCTNDEHYPICPHGTCLPLRAVTQRNMQLLSQNRDTVTLHTTRL
jgi:hypothetical protein